VRVLLDQNLSPKLIRKLADVHPGLESVYDHDLTGSSDRFIFEWARRSEFSALVLAERFGPPPKVIRIERCDFRFRIIELLLRREAIRIYSFLESNRAVLLLSL
jgi:predicted nuclease of predicted toxin-antitoxin system